MSVEPWQIKKYYRPRVLIGVADLLDPPLPDMTLVCLDAADGRRLWARNTAGAMRMAIDPKTDDLCVWRESLHRLSCTDGEITSQTKFPGDHGRVHALLVRGQVLADQTAYPPIPDSATMFNLSTGKIVKQSLSERKAMSPHEKWLIEDATQCQALARRIDVALRNGDLEVESRHIATWGESGVPAVIYTGKMSRRDREG